MSAPVGGSGLAELERRARSAVDAVADDPDGRLELRMAFYRKYGRGQELRDTGRLDPRIPDADFGFGRSELDFLRWEIRRGVLNPLDGSRGAPGSRWWRDVDLAFLYAGQLAALIHEAGADPAEAPLPARRWLDYIEKPGEVSWYRAHNTSIVAGYAGCIGCAEGEAFGEQIFMNVVLYRLLYAQGMVEGFEFGLLGRLLADPVFPSVDALVHLPDFYPDNYPLSDEDIRHIMNRGRSLEELGVWVLDVLFIHPQLARLYRHAETWVGLPMLGGWVKGGRPVYPTLQAPPPLRVRLRAFIQAMARRLRIA